MSVTSGARACGRPFGASAHLPANLPGYADYSPASRQRFERTWGVRPPAAELPDGDYPFVLNTGRLLYHWHGGTLTRRVQRGGWVSTRGARSG